MSQQGSYPMLTEQARSRWSSNNPCSELAQSAVQCRENEKQHQSFGTMESVRVSCDPFFERYKQCMTTNEFEKKKLEDRKETAQQSIHTSAYSLFTWKV